MGVLDFIGGIINGIANGVNYYNNATNQNNNQNNNQPQQPAQGQQTGQQTGQNSNPANSGQTTLTNLFAMPFMSLTNNVTSMLGSVFQQTAYRMNLARPKEEKWYKGETPTTREIYGRIATLAQTNPEGATELASWLGRQQQNPESQYYNKYDHVTNRAVDNLAAMGIDTSNINDDWFRQTSWLANYLVFNGTTNAPTSPGKKASAEQKAAYEWFQIGKANETTKKAQNEWAALQEELAYWATNDKTNLSDDQIIERIYGKDGENFKKKYPTLASMDDSTKDPYGTPIELNSVIGYSKDNVYGTLWAARNGGGTGNREADMALSASGYGNQWVENPEISAKLNVNDSNTYSPYSVGMTLEEEGLYFGVREFTRETIDQLLANPHWDDETWAENMRSVQEAEATTEAAEKELEELNRQKAKWISQNLSEEKIMKKLDAYMDEHCPTLRKMDKGIGSREPVATTRAIDYRYEDLKNDVSRGVMDRDLQGSGLEQTNTVTEDIVGPESEPETPEAQETTETAPGQSGRVEDQSSVTASAGGSDVNVGYNGMTGDPRYRKMTQQEIESDKARDAILHDSVSAVEDDLTAGESAHMQNAGTVSFPFMVRAWNAVKEKIDAVGKVRDEFAAKQIGNANAQYTQAAFESSQLIRDYERNSANYSALQKTERDLYEKYGHLDLIGKEIPDATSASININGIPVTIYAARDMETGEYKFSGMAYSEIGMQFLPGEEEYELFGGKEAMQDRIDSALNSLNTYANNVAEANKTGYVLTDEDKAHLQEYYTARAELWKASEYIGQNQEAYEEAKKTESKARDDLYRTYSILSRLGIDTDGGQKHLQLIDHAMDYGNYKRTKHAYSDVNVFEESIRGMRFTDSEGNVNYPQEYIDYFKGNKAETDEKIADIQYLLDYFGDQLPASYTEAYRKQIAELQWDSKEYEYFLLRENEDWDSMVEAGKKLDQDNFTSDYFVYGNAMTEEEKERYWYLYGRDGEQAAREYYDHLQDSENGTLKKRTTENIEAATRSMVEESWILSNALSIATAPASAITNMIGLGVKAVTGEDVGDTAFGWLNTIANTTQEETSQMIRDHFGEDTIAGKVIGGLYEIAWNRGRSMMNAAAFPGLGALNEFFGSVPMAATAMFDSISKAEEQGIEDWQAWTLGAVTFLCEAGTEMIELGNIKGAKELGLDSLSGIKEFLKQYPINGLSEALGESLNDIIENAADRIVLGDESERNDRAWYYQTTMGMTKEDAEAMAIKDEIYGVLHTAIISYLSPGMDIVSFASGKVALYDHYRRETKAMQQQGYNVSLRDIRNAERAEALTEREAVNAEENAPVSEEEDEWHIENPNVTVEDVEDFSPVKPNKQEVTAQEKEYATEMEILESVKGMQDASSRTAGIASVLNFGDQEANEDRANAAAVHVEDVFENGAEDIQELMEGGIVSGTNINSIKVGIQYAALGGENSACAQVIQSEEYKNATPDVKAEMLAQAAVSDARNQEVQEAVAMAVHENRIAEQEKIIIANGGMPETAKASEAMYEAAAANRQAQEDLEVKQGEAEAAAQANEAATAEFVQNPTDANRKQVESTTTELRQRDESAMQYEQHKAKLQAALEKAKAATDGAKQRELTSVRQQAEAVVADQDRQRAEREAQRAEQERIAAEQAAQAQAEEDQRSGKADEDRTMSFVEDWANNMHLEGTEREAFIQRVMERREQKALGKIDMTGKVSNAEGYLAVQAFARKTGLQFQLSETLPDGARGSYSNGVVQLNANLVRSGQMTIGQALVEASLHEVTHSMEGTRNYRNYRNIVLENLFNAEGNQTTDQLYNSNTDFRAAVDQKILDYEKVGKNLTKAEAEQEIVADFARLHLADKEVVQRFMDAGMGGRMRNALHNANQALKNFFRSLKGEDRKQAEYLRRAERAYQKAIDDVAKTAVHPSEEQFSIMQVAQATGMAFDAEKMELRDRNGNLIDGVEHKIGVSDIVKTPVGYLIRNGLNRLDGENAEQAAAEKDYIDPTSTAGKALDMMTGLMNMIARYKQSDLVWEIGASTLSSTFSALKSNSDTQYQTTVGFGTICAKTQAIIDVMSQVMMDKIDPKTGMLKEGMKAGLTRKEIMKVYDATHHANLSVPCPVCYVFSRWMGVPSLLGQMSQFQKNYVATKKNADGSTAVDKNGNIVIDWDATQKLVDDYLFSTEKGKEGMLVKYKDKDAINDKKTSLNNRMKTLEEKRNALETRLLDKTLSKEERGNINQQIESVLSDMVNVEDQLAEVRAFNWVTQALCLQKRKGNSAFNVIENGHYVLDKKFKYTPDNILFDLNRTSEFAEYEKNWSYRNTRGAGMGKSIMPYSGETIGDMLYNGKGKRKVNNPWTNFNYESDAKNSAAIRQLNDTRKRAKQQNLLGGQRLQSTSDFRPEWGLDYIMSFLELQAAGSKVQMYTKVAEAVDFFASVGADVNLSIMGQGTGWHEATEDELNKLSAEERAVREVKLGDKTYLMDFSPITGMEYFSDDATRKTATSLKNAHDNVQMILVGMNDTHIRLAMRNGNIDFIIPWHSSGNSKEVLANLISSVGEKLNTSVDYTTTQSDMKKGETKTYYDENGEKVEYSAPGEQTEEEKHIWDLRMRILTGKADKETGKGGFTEQERKEVYNNPWLRQLYDRFYVKGVDDSCYHVALSGKQAGQIFPYEYWATGLVFDENTGKYIRDPNQKGATKETADENGKRFVEYCEMMGIIPRFSQFKDDPGYWKLLIDRPMYNNDGTYHDQQTINVTNARVGQLDESGKLDRSTTDLPTQAKAVYAPKDKRSPMYEEYKKRETNAIMESEKALGIPMNERQEEAVQDAEAIQDAVYSDGADEQLSVFGDMTDADIDQMLAQANQDYNDAVARGDMEAAQQDVDFAAEQAGYTDKAYHGTNSFGFTKFDMEKSQGEIFVAYNSNVAGTYADAGDSIRRINETEDIADRLYSMDSEEIVDWLNNLDEQTKARLEKVGIRFDVASADDDGWINLDSEEESMGFARQDLVQKIEELNTGVYELYTKPGRQLVIECDGHSWKNIPWALVVEADPDAEGEHPEMTSVNTRKISEWAKEHGYDSVRINAIYDNGGSSFDFGEAYGDIGIFFNPNDVKSADPVTYDENGNPIPLSERFNQQNPDIRYSAGGELTDADLDQMLAQADRDYSDAVSRGKTKQAQQMVDEAAKDAGYIYGKVYHGTPNNDFTEFRDGFIFFTSNKDTASEYQNPGTMWSTNYNGGRTLGSYIKLDNPLILDNSYSDYRNEHTPWQEWKPTVYGRVPDNAMNAQEVAERAKELGYDGVIIRNDKDTKWSDSDKYLKNRGRGDTIIAFYANQIKSADAVTYDENGNVIPLSERFNQQNRDFRYSAGGEITDADIDQQLANAGLLPSEEVNANVPGQPTTLPGMPNEGESDQRQFSGQAQGYSAAAAAYSDSELENYSTLPEELRGPYTADQIREIRYHRFELRDDLNWLPEGQQNHNVPSVPNVPNVPTVTMNLNPANDTRQRQWGREGAQRSDELAEQAKQYVLAHNEYYPDTNAEQIDRAIEWVRGNRNHADSDGYRESLEKVTSKRFNYRTADGQARMVAVMGMAVAMNDVEAQVRLADAYNQQGTDLGQALQARKLWRLMTPQGRISSLQKMLQNSQDEMNAKGSNVELKLSDFIYMAAAAATEEGDFRKVQQAAAHELAEQIPANWRDKLRGWRMLSMLGNPRTHIRNIVGNALFVPAVGLKNKIGAIGEMVSGQKDRSKTLSLFLNKDARDFARKDARFLKDTLTGEAKYNEDNAVQREQKPFKGLLQAIIDFNSNRLEGEDWFFLRGHYRRALGGWMMANGYTSEQLKNDQKLLEKGRAYAVEEAQRATYRDFNKLAATLNKVSRDGGVAGFLVDATLPFKKTPANILKRGIEYSPVGIMRSLTADIYHLKQWNDAQRRGLSTIPEKAISPTQFIDRLSSGLAGTAIMAVGALLGSMGLVSCGLDDDDDELEKAKGAQKYAIKILGTDYTFTVDWAAPMSMPFFVGAAIQKQFENQEGFDVEELVDAFGNITEPVFNLSMLDGVNSLFKTSQYDDTNTLTQIGAKIGSNYVTSYVPSLLGAFARLSDEKQRKSFVESGKGTGVLGTFRYAYEQTQNKIPGWNQTNIPARDVWGNAKTSGLAERILENFILPGYIEEYRDDPILNEMGRLYDSTGDAGMIPSDPNKTVTYNKQKYVLTAEQWDTYKETRGQAAYEGLSELIQTEDYLNADDAVQAQMIKDVWSYADKIGKKAIIPDFEMEDMGDDPVASIAKDAKITGYQNEMIKALNSGDYDAYGTMLEALYEADVEEGTIKTKIGNTYRDLYKDAYRKKDYGRMAEIEELLENTGFAFDIGKWEEQVDEKYGGNSGARFDPNTLFASGSGVPLGIGNRLTRQTDSGDGTGSMPQRPASDDDWGQYMDNLDEYWADYDFDLNDPTATNYNGTIDLNNREIVHNDDGSISTEYSYSFYDDNTGKEVLIPRVVNGRIVSDEEAKRHYYETGEHLGMFDDWHDADEYAMMLHNRQNWYYNR